MLLSAATMTIFDLPLIKRDLERAEYAGDYGRIVRLIGAEKWANSLSRSGFLDL